MKFKNKMSLTSILLLSILMSSCISHKKKDEFYYLLLWLLAQNQSQGSGNQGTGSPSYPMVREDFTQTLSSSKRCSGEPFYNNGTYVKDVNDPRDFYSKIPSEISNAKEGKTGTQWARVVFYGDNNSIDTDDLVCCYQPVGSNNTTNKPYKFKWCALMSDMGGGTNCSAYWNNSSIRTTDNKNDVIRNFRVELIIDGQGSDCTRVDQDFEMTLIP